MKHVLMIALAGMLSGCFGRESHSNQPPAPSAVPPAFNTASPLNAQPTCNLPKVRILSPLETHADYTKAMVNAQVAYELGLTGHCVRVAVMDSGLTTDPHPDLPRSRVDIIKGSFYTDGQASEVLNDGTVFPHADARHGTATTGLIVAASDGIGMHGMAPGAKVSHWSLVFGSGGGGRGYQPLPLAAIANEDASLKIHFQAVMDVADIVNLSWGWAAPLTGTDGAGNLLYTEAALRQALPTTIDLVAQASTDVDDRTLFIWAAHNYGRESLPATPSSPELLAALPVRIPELSGHWLAVVAVDESGTIADFSNRCGLAQASCLAAPGVCVLTTTAYAPTAQRQLPGGRYNTSRCGEIYDGQQPDYNKLNGTSFAAPIVTGALALVFERFQGQLGNTAALARLLATANKTGIYSDASIYGQGLLDVGAAVQPVGQNALAIAGAMVPLPGLTRTSHDHAGLLALLGNSLAGQTIMVNDELGAPFWLPFSHLPGATPAPVDERWLDMPSLSRQERIGNWTQTITHNAGSRAGYSLDNRADHSAGWFVSTDMHPGQLTGLSALTLQPGDFARQGVFSPPWLDWVADRTRGAGVNLPTGSGILTAAMFQGQAAPLANTAHSAAGSSNLALLEYRRSSDALHWMLQAGRIDEAQSWSGLSTAGSIYGDFAADTHYLAISAHWTPVEGIQLLGAFNTASTQLDTRLPGLLSHIGSLNQRHLELGALARSVLLPNDSLSLRWQARQSRAGQVNWRLPVGLYRRQITYQDLQFDLTGPQHQRLELGWKWPMAERSRLTLRLGRSFVSGESTPPSDHYAAFSFHLSL